MRKSFKEDAKAVSPVISTIIIVSVAIVMSIAVAYWMLGLGSSFTRFEKLEIRSAYTDGDFTVHLDVKNTGSAALTIDQVFLNGRPADSYNNVTVSWDSVNLEPGQDTTGTISLSEEEWSSGMSIEVTIKTAAGREYPKTVVLP